MGLVAGDAVRAAGRKAGRISVDQAINVLVTITLIQLMAAIGLGVTTAEIAPVARDWGLLAKAALANYGLVPAITVGLLLLLRAPPSVAAGFLVAAVCPGAPYGPPLTGMAKGDVPISIGLMVTLAGSSTIVAGTWRNVIATPGACALTSRVA